MWSRYYDKCISCGKTEHKHAAKGQCVACYNLKYYNKNINKIKKKKHEWWKNKQKAKNQGVCNSETNH